MAGEEPCMDILSDEVIRRHFNTVYTLAMARAGSKDAAEDIVQEVFLRFLSAKRNFESDEHIKAWLIRVTINCSKSYLTSAWLRKIVPLYEEITFTAPEKSEVYFAVQEIPVKYRTVIHLFYYEDMSIKEISHVLHISESAVKSRLHRGRNLLKSKLKGGYDFV